MQLGRYQVSTLRPPPILSIDFSLDGRLFAVALETGYEVWKTCPLGLVRRRALPGTLARALPLPNSPLLALQGGGKSPLYPPNKVVLYHDGLGVAVAELEFGEKVRGVTCRASTLCVALSRRVIAFQYGMSDSADPSGKGKGKAKDEFGFIVTKLGEWETAPNERGLIALASTLDSTLIAIPGRQTGHVQLINLPPCSPSSSTQPSRTTRAASQAFRSPIILAHEHELSSLACTASGSHIITTSERGTLLRVWSTSQGRLERELRRGVDRAETWGVQFEDAVVTPKGNAGPGTEERRRDDLRSKGGRVVGWSDKGTIHIWGHTEDDPRQEGFKGPAPAPSLTHLLSRNLPLPKYFSSSPSSALYRLPRKNPHAFASTVSAAAEAARMPSMKMREAGEEEGEWNERFVVCWVEVEVEQDVEKAKPAVPLAIPRRGSISGVPTLEMGIGMGTREERRSFGSDATTRAATPTSTTYGRDTPTPSIPTLHRTATSNSARPEPKRTMTPRQDSLSSHDRDRRASAKPKQTKTERQLVAITFGGDWYRLRIPEDAGVAEDEAGLAQKKTGRKCELVEYRRLNVGGGGW